MSTTQSPQPRATRRATVREPLLIDLALQGGGSHGAFTWGVLDRLLQDDGPALDGLSGTSAGALNAAVLASGFADGGRAGARAALQAFWLDLSASGGCFGPAPMLRNAGAGGAQDLSAFNLDGLPLYNWTQQWLNSFSPYQFNPFDLNPLRDVVARHVNAAALRKGPLALFVTATEVRSGQPRIFTRKDLSVDALLASACLPQLFKAVTIDGHAYWDGGYSGNPALWPLIYETRALDLLLVRINPLLRPELPDTAAEISDRVNEITFNAGLMAEMRAIGFVQRLIAQGKLDDQQYKNLRLHEIADDAGLAPLHPSSKLNTDRRFLERLRDLGHAAADAWLRAHRADLGRRATLHPDRFLQPR